MNKIKILEIFGEPIAHGGQESFVVELLSHMNQEDMKIDMLTPYYCDNQAYRDLMKNIGVSIISFDLPSGPVHFRWKVFIKIKQYLIRNNYDVVHIHSGSILALSMIALAARICRVRKIIVHSHCGIEKETCRHFIVKKLSYPFMKLCPTDFFACSKDAGMAKFSDSIVRNKLIVIKNGVDLNKFSYDEEIRYRVRKQYNISHDTFVVGHVGRFTYQKNQTFLLDIFNEIYRKNQNAKLLLIGSGEDEQKIIKKITELHLDDIVILCGNVSNVNEIMQAMDVFVFPSNFEGFGIVGLEAQALGLPVIASDKVPKDLQVTSLLSYMPLKESAEEWAKRIIEAKEIKRKTYHDQIEAAGYSVDQTARIVEEKYRAVSRKSTCG